VYPASGRFLDVNDAFCALTGYTREELLTKTTSDITHPADRVQDKEEYGRLLRGEITAYTREKRYIRKNGDQIWVHLDIGAVRQADGAPLYTIGVIQDITERKRTEEEARRITAHMAILASAAGDLLNNDPNQYLASLYQRVGLELDLDAYFHFAVTEDGSRLTLQSFGGITPQGAEQIRHIEFGQGIAGTAAMKRRMIVVEDVAVGSDPRAPFLASTGMRAAVGFPLMRGSRVIGALSFATRLSSRFRPGDLDLLRALADYVAAALERSRLMNELEQRNSDLQRSNTDLEQFAYSVCHDLQEPLRGIASFADLLARRYERRLDADANDFIRYISSGAERMQQMIQGILAYSRVRRQDRTAREPVDMNRVANWALENLQGAIEESGAKIDCGRLPAVVGDFAQLVTVMQNLVGNAIKYHHESKPHVKVSAAREGSQWVIAVQDNGRGIDPQDHKRIFDLFNRLRNARDQAGSGIGLAICRKIVEQSGGRIWVESQSGSGATFFFTVSAVEM
jgi:PAS domain S-box-containing protein